MAFAPSLSLALGNPCIYAIRVLPRASSHRPRPPVSAGANAIQNTPTASKILPSVEQNKPYPIALTHTRSDIQSLRLLLTTSLGKEPHCILRQNESPHAATLLLVANIPVPSFCSPLGAYFVRQSRFLSSLCRDAQVVRMDVRGRIAACSVYPEPCRRACQQDCHAHPRSSMDPA